MLVDLRLINNNIAYILPLQTVALFRDYSVQNVSFSSCPVLSYFTYQNTDAVKTLTCTLLYSAPSVLLNQCSVSSLNLYRLRLVPLGASVGLYIQYTVYL